MGFKLHHGCRGGINKVLHILTSKLVNAVLQRKAAKSFVSIMYMVHATAHVNVLTSCICMCASGNTGTDSCACKEQDSAEVGAAGPCFARLSCVALSSSWLLVGNEGIRAQKTLKGYIYIYIYMYI